MDRELKFINEREVEFYKFGSFYKEGKQKVKRLLTNKEIEKAHEVINSKDEYRIDAFCYSIA